MDFELKHHFNIEAARRLENLPSDHPCHRLHGHSFKITLVYRGPLQEKTEWLYDYHEIGQHFEPLRRRLDHAYLNEIEGLGPQPTSEKIAQWIYDRLKIQQPLLYQVQVCETPVTECTYPVSHR